MLRLARKLEQPALRGMHADSFDEPNLVAPHQHVVTRHLDHDRVKERRQQLEFTPGFWRQKPSLSNVVLEYVLATTPILDNKIALVMGSTRCHFGRDISFFIACQYCTFKQYYHVKLRLPFCPRCFENETFVKCNVTDRLCFQ